MRIAIYSRKSKFTGKGESIDNQIQLCKEYISGHFNNYEIVVYEDEGFSGGNIDRPQYKELLQDIKKKNINALICYRLDRISRNVADFSSVLELLEKNNIIFVSIREQFDTSSPMGKAMIYIASVFAQLERETIAERVRDNMMELAKTGRWLGGKTPTGFKSTKITSIVSGKEKSSQILEPIEEEQELIKLIYEKYLEFGSLNKVETFFLNLFVKTKYGNRMDIGTIKKIISNPVYCVADALLYEYCTSNNMLVVNEKSEFDGSHAVISYNKNDGKLKKPRSTDKWIIAIGAHKGFIPSKVWVQAQNILLENFNKFPREDTGKISLLSTLLRCKCGSIMKIAGKYVDGELKHYYYRCKLKTDTKGKQCSMPNLQGKKAEMQILEELKNVLLNESSTTDKLNKRKKNTDIKNSAKEKDNILKEISKKESSIEKFTISLIDNEGSSASKYIIKQIESLDEGIKALKIRLKEFEEEKENNLIKEMNHELYLENLKKLVTNIDTLKFEEKKKLLRSVVKQITWDGVELVITPMGDC